LPRELVGESLRRLVDEQADEERVAVIFVCAGSLMAGDCERYRRIRLPPKGNGSSA